MITKSFAVGQYPVGDAPVGIGEGQVYGENYNCVVHANNNTVIKSAYVHRLAPVTDTFTRLNTAISKIAGQFNATANNNLLRKQVSPIKSHSVAASGTSQNTQVFNQYSALEGTASGSGQPLAVRQIVDSTHLSGGSGGTQIQITMTYGSATIGGPNPFDRTWIGQQIAGGSPGHSYDGNQVQVTWNSGQSQPPLGAAGANVVSDVITLNEPFNPSANYIFGYDINAAYAVSYQPSGESPMIFWVSSSYISTNFANNTDYADPTPSNAAGLTMISAIQIMESGSSFTIQKNVEPIRLFSASATTNTGQRALAKATTFLTTTATQAQKLVNKAAFTSVVHATVSFFQASLAFLKTFPHTAHANELIQKMVDPIRLFNALATTQIQKKVAETKPTGATATTQLVKSVGGIRHFAGTCSTFVGRQSGILWNSVASATTQMQRSVGGIWNSSAQATSNLQKSVGTTRSAITNTKVLYSLTQHVSRLLSATVATGSQLVKAVTLTPYVHVADTQSFILAGQAFIRAFNHVMHTTSAISTQFSFGRIFTSTIHFATSVSRNVAKTVNYTAASGFTVLRHSAITLPIQATAQFTYALQNSFLRTFNHITTATSSVLANFTIARLFIHSLAANSLIHAAKSGNVVKVVANVMTNYSILTIVTNLIPKIVTTMTGPIKIIPSLTTSQIHLMVSGIAPTINVVTGKVTGMVKVADTGIRTTVQQIVNKINVR